MQCSHWTEDVQTWTNEDGDTVTRRNATRCQSAAEVRMVAPDGFIVPGCWYCQAHADAAVAEYREKLQEVWRTVPTVA